MIAAGLMAQQFESDPQALPGAPRTFDILSDISVIFQGKDRTFATFKLPYVKTALIFL